MRVPTELLLNRLLDAPRERVFEAWTDPAHLQKWWGPEAFCNPRCEWESRAGGGIHVDMRGPDGTVYPMGGEVVEVVPPERIVFLTRALDAAGEALFESRNVVTLSEEGARTRLRLQVIVSKIRPEAARHLAGMEQGWAQSLLRLDALVWEPLSDRELVAQRWVPATPAQVQAAWTDPRRLARFWGPHGFRTTSEVCEPRPGGAWRFVMHGPDGKDYPNECAFVEVGEDRIVIDHVSAPRFRITVTFTAEGAGTRVVFRQAFEDAATCRLIAKFALQGNEENLDRLAAEVAG
ncbi:hypothetical protein GETHPA_28720 [Geothrix rubra]|uniref:Activator of Hsp90 ATPase homologue 1/2-like C-terminal domain-containing protein n=1 Tax=Geothrix rubra TaxID=2927977 RepID=A0ABQ5QBB7_9BACT|nr:SRPBCC family protein [Geothrix rubra]GLH71339.1 hypothetical protein GETHPA_28720 [Geothrix rubra]